MDIFIVGMSLLSIAVSRLSRVRSQAPQFFDLFGRALRFSRLPPQCLRHIRSRFLALNVSLNTGQSTGIVRIMRALRVVRLFGRVGSLKKIITVSAVIFFNSAVTLGKLGDKIIAYRVGTRLL
jgi:hypothetical protein